MVRDCRPSEKSSRELSGTKPSWRCPIAHGLFDAQRGMLQSGRTMRLLRILLVLAGTVVAAIADTNTTEVRKMSLDDCIQAVLERNLDLQIARLAVPEALQDLKAAFGGWDPTFDLSG